MPIHLRADPGDYAEACLLPGDPLRAQYIAETFLADVKQVNGEVFVNKDCKMNFNGHVGPIGTLDNADLILSTLHDQLENDSLSVIQCKKHNCLCGLCAPKAKDLKTYNSIMEKYYL